MTRHNSIALALILFLSGAYSFAQPSQSQFHEKVLKTYDFSPHKLTRDQQEAKSKVLDEFWEYVKASPTDFLPMLRIELQNISSQPFFLYDGGVLLLSLSQERTDKQLVAETIARCDFMDVTPSEYLRTVNRLANDGIDVRAAAYKILDDPSFVAFFPQHSLKLNQDYSFISAMFPMPDSLFIDECISRLATTTNDTIAKTLILALWYTTTQKAFDAILATGADKAHSTAVQEFAKKKSEELILLMAKYIGQPSPDSYDQLKLKRQSSLRSVSDENLYEFASLTQRLQVAFFNKE